MITGWLSKIVLGIALVGFLVVELVSPVVVRAQLDGIAHDAADNAALHLLDRPADTERAREIAEEIVAEEDGVALTVFTVGTGGVSVTVQRQARSFLLGKVEQLKSWYDVKVSASAATVRR